MSEILDCYKKMRTKFKANRKRMVEEEYSIYLCHIVSELYDNSKISREVYKQVKLDIENHLIEKAGSIFKTMMDCIGYDFSTIIPYQEMVKTTNDYRLNFLNDKIKSLTTE